MSVTDVEELEQTIEEVDVAGRLQINYSRKFKVNTNSRTDSGFTVLAHNQIPAFNSKVVTVTGHDLWCRRRVPKKVNTHATQKQWHVHIYYNNVRIQQGSTVSFYQTFDGSPETDPTEAQARYDVDYVVEMKDVWDATLLDFRHAGATFPRPPSYGRRHARASGRWRPPVCRSPCHRAA